MQERLLSREFFLGPGPEMYTYPQLLCCSILTATGDARTAVRASFCDAVGICTGLDPLLPMVSTAIVSFKL